MSKNNNYKTCISEEKLHILKFEENNNTIENYILILNENLKKKLKLNKYLYIITEVEIIKKNLQLLV